MTTATINKTGPRKVDLPRDLRQTLGERILLKLALDAVQTLDQARLEDIAREYKKHRPQMLLTLASYCYAAGIYSSQAIVDAIRNNRTVRYICAHANLDRPAIRRFRRRNRPVLEQCLAALLRKAWLWELEDGSNWPTTDMKAQCLDAARQKIEMAVLMDMAESD